MTTDTKAPKTPKEAKAPKAVTIAGFAPTAKISFLTDKKDPPAPYGPKNNPKREGTEGHRRFGLYKANMTVQAAIDAGVTKADISWDVKHGFIAVA